MAECNCKESMATCKICGKCVACFGRHGDGWCSDDRYVDAALRVPLQERTLSPDLWADLARRCNEYNTTVPDVIHKLIEDREELRELHREAREEIKILMPIVRAADELECKARGEGYTLMNDLNVAKPFVKPLAAWRDYFWRKKDG